MEDAITAIRCAKERNPLPNADDCEEDEQLLRRLMWQESTRTSSLRSIAELRRFLEELERHEPGEFFYAPSRTECVKEFELALEESARLLRRQLRPHLTSTEEANGLVSEELIRYSARIGLIPLDASERWVECHRPRNGMAHLYGDELAEPTLHRFLEDGEEFARVIGEGFNEWATGTAGA